MMKCCRLWPLHWWVNNMYWRLPAATDHPLLRPSAVNRASPAGVLAAAISKWNARPATPDQHTTSVTSALHANM